MSTRALFRDATVSHQGNTVIVLPFASVAVYYAGTNDPVIEDMYTTDAGMTTLTNPFTSDADGNYAFYMDNEDEVKLVITHPTSGTLILDDMQVRRPAGNYASLSSTETLTNKKIGLQDGAEDDPALFYVSETGGKTGLYKSGPDEWATTVDDTTVHIIDALGLKVIGAIRLADGTVSLPAFYFTSENDVNSGFYKPGEAQIGVTINGTQQLQIDANGILALNGHVKAGRFTQVIGTTIASASTIAPPSGGGGSTFHISGTTTINTITARETGDTITLIADGIWSLGSSGNIVAGKQPRPVGTSVSLIYDGTNWYEIGSRSKFAGMTLVVASSTASESIKARADYICDGTADEVEINAALTALPSTGGRVVLSDGTFTIADQVATAKANTVLEGVGWSTIIKAVNSGGSGVNKALVKIGHNLCELRDLEIDGNATNNASATAQQGWRVQSGIYCRVTNVYTTSCAGTAGGWVDSGSYGILVSGCYAASNVGTGFLCDASASVIVQFVDCMAALNSVSGFSIVGPGLAIKGCRAYGNGSYGFSVTSASTDASLVGCTARNDGVYGFIINGTRTHVASCNAFSCGNTGFALDSSSVNCTLAACVSSINTGSGFTTLGSGHNINSCAGVSNLQHGIVISSTETQLISSIFELNGTSLATTFDNIIVTSDNNFIAGNTCRRGSSGNRARYGIAIASGTNNFIGTNNLFEGGVTGEILDSGTNTRRQVKLQLDYIAATDLLSSTSITANTWTDVTANQNFRVDSATSILEFVVMGNMQIGSATVGNVSSTRIVIDSAGTPINKKIGGEILNVTGVYANPLSGSSPVKISGLAIGTHTIKLQVRSVNAATGFLRASSVAETEHLNMQATEFQR